MSGPRLQSNLGITETQRRKDNDMYGYLAWGRVLKVYPKYNSADVYLIRNKDVVVGASHNEGKFSARILTNQAGHNDGSKINHGTINPVLVGDVVLLGFVDGLKTQPVILGSAHRMDNPENTLPNANDRSPEGERELLKYLSIYPSQHYNKIDGDGNVETGYSSQSFFIATYDDITDTMQYDSLSEVSVGQVKEFIKRAGSNDLTSQNMLFCHQSYNNTDTRFFMPKEGGLKVTRNDTKGQTTIEITPDGDLELDFGKSGKHVLLKIGDSTVTLTDNSISLEATSVSVESQNFSVSSNNINISADKNINIKSEEGNIRIEAPNIVGEQTITVQAPIEGSTWA